jgi:hypothetical protein
MQKKINIEYCRQTLLIRSNQYNRQARTQFIEGSRDKGNRVLTDRFVQRVLKLIADAGAGHHTLHSKKFWNAEINICMLHGGQLQICFLVSPFWILFRAVLNLTRLALESFYL